MAPSLGDTATAQQVAVAPAAKVPAAAQDRALRGDDARTRFVIVLERPVEFQVFSLTNPNRVFVDLDDVRMQLPPQPGASAVYSRKE